MSVDIERLRAMHNLLSAKTVVFRCEGEDYYVDSPDLTGLANPILGSDTYYPWVPDAEVVEFWCALHNALPAILAELERGRRKLEAMSIVLSLVSAKANIENDKLVALLQDAESGVMQIEAALAKEHSDG